MAGWSDLWLPDSCLVVLAAVCESHGAKPSLASWPACQHPVRAIGGACVQRDIANSQVQCPSLAPELLGVQDSRSQDLRAVGRQVASMCTGSKKH